MGEPVLVQRSSDDFAENRVSVSGEDRFIVKDVVKRFESAVDRLLCCDVHLLTVDANERSISHKLAEHLQSMFTNWDVDCEYNRDGHDPKRVDLGAVDAFEGQKNASVYPDIIVHRRGTDENLLIVEVKKSSNRRRDALAHDRRKLLAYLRSLGYTVGILVVFNTDGQMENMYTMEVRCPEDA